VVKDTKTVTEKLRKLRLPDFGWTAPGAELSVSMMFKGVSRPPASFFGFAKHLRVKH
jgi:hypothetical protein